MSTYRVSYIAPTGIEFAINDGVIEFLQRNGLVGFEPLPVDVPTFRRPLRDGARSVGRPYTASRECGVLTNIMHDSHSDLAAWIAARLRVMNPYQDEDASGAVRVYTPDGRTRQIDAWPSDIPRIALNGPVVAHMAYQFFCPYPFFYDPTLQEMTIALSTPGGLTPPITPPILFSATTIDSRETVTNDGEIASWPVITIYGPGTDPVVENETAGEVMDLTGAGSLVLDVGDYVIIDMDAATILVHDASVPSDTYVPQARTATSKFWRLLVGDNTIHVTMDAVTTGAVKMTWYEWYRGGV